MARLCLQKAIYCVAERRWIQHLVVPLLKQIRCLPLRCLRTTIRDSFRRKHASNWRKAVRSSSDCTMCQRPPSRSASTIRRAFPSPSVAQSEPLSEGKQIIFTEIMEIRILKGWKSRPTTTPTRATASLAPTKPESGKGSKTRTRPEYVGKTREYEMDFPPTHADCAGAGLYVFTKRRGPG